MTEPSSAQTASQRVAAWVRSNPGEVSVRLWASHSLGGQPGWSLYAATADLEGDLLTLGLRRTSYSGEGQPQCSGKASVEAEIRECAIWNDAIVATATVLSVDDELGGGRQLFKSRDMLADYQWRLDAGRWFPDLEITARGGGYSQLLPAGHARLGGWLPPAAFQWAGSQAGNYEADFRALIESGLTAGAALEYRLVPAAAHLARRGRWELVHELLCQLGYRRGPVPWLNRFIARLEYCQNPGPADELFRNSLDDFQPGFADSAVARWQHETNQWTNEPRPTELIRARTP